ncbi:MAG TPA: ATP-binding protein [Streptosporangiaceae bacterium]
MQDPELAEIIGNLRLLGADIADVEVKNSRGGLPKSLRDTLSAFSNTRGGVLILGLDEPGVIREVQELRKEGWPQCGIFPQVIAPQVVVGTQRPHFFNRLRASAITAHRSAGCVSLRMRSSRAGTKVVINRFQARRSQSANSHTRLAQLDNGGLYPFSGEHLR